MRVSQRQRDISIAQTQLELKLLAYWDERSVNNIEALRMLTFEMREILLGMEPVVPKATRYSALKDLIRGHQVENGMTDVEVLQALFSHGSSALKYMLRYERHGDYDKPAGLD